LDINWGAARTKENLMEAIFLFVLETGSQGGRGRGQRELSLRKYLSPRGGDEKRRGGERRAVGGRSGEAPHKELKRRER